MKETRKKEKEKEGLVWGQTANEINHRNDRRYSTSR